MQSPRQPQKAVESVLTDAAKMALRIEQERERQEEERIAEEFLRNRRKEQSCPQMLIAA